MVLVGCGYWLLVCGGGRVVGIDCCCGVGGVWVLVIGVWFWWGVGIGF